MMRMAQMPARVPPKSSERTMTGPMRRMPATIRALSAVGSFLNTAAYHSPCGRFRTGAIRRAIEGPPQVFSILRVVVFDLGGLDAVDELGMAVGIDCVAVAVVG